MEFQESDFKQHMTKAARLIAEAANFLKPHKGVQGAFDGDAFVWDWIREPDVYVKIFLQPDFLFKGSSIQIFACVRNFSRCYWGRYISVEEMLERKEMIRREMEDFIRRAWNDLPVLMEHSSKFEEQKEEVFKKLRAMGIEITE